MAKDKTIEVSISPLNMKRYEMLKTIAEQKGLSVSDLINDGINQIYMQELTHVRISVGAYAALADGNLDALHCFELNSGVHMVTLDESRYKDQYSDIVHKYLTE